MAEPFPRKQWEKQEWDQLKGLTKTEVIRLLKKDDRWQFVHTSGSRYVFRNDKLKPPHNYLAIHFHPSEGYRNPGLLRDILDHWCCTRDDLKRWKVIR